MIGYCPTVGGGWARSFMAHESQLHRADGLSDEVAVLADPLASALRPVLLHPPAEDDDILIIGAGTIGVLTVSALRMTGWQGEITVLGRHPFQLELAEAAGADRLIRSRDELYQWAGSLEGARHYKPTLAPRFVEGGPSLIYDTVGTQGSAGDTLALAREAGRIVLVGAAARLTTDWTRLWYRQLTLAGVFAYGLAPSNGEHRDIYDLTIELLHRDHFADLGMVTHIFPLEEYRAGLSAALDKSGHRSVKVAFRPGG
jgi:threonine dehydrogenase-like Zn-dependent dehydrogenase